MPSNKQYTEEAIKTAQELGLKIETKGLSNEKLAALVSDLKAKKKDAERETLADKAEEDAAALVSDLKAKKKDAERETLADKAEEDAAALVSDLKAKKEKPPFYVKEGKAVTSKRGILFDGDEIRADDLAGGVKALNDFVKSGHVVKS